MTSQFQTLRSPVYSMMQSALNESLQRKQLSNLNMGEDHPAMQQFYDAAKNRLGGGLPSDATVAAVAAAGAPATVATTVVAGTAAATSVLSATPAATLAPNCAELYAELGWADIKGDIAKRTQLANALKYSTCDPLWTEAVTTYLAWQAGHAPIPYVTYDNLTDFVSDLPAPQAADNRLVIGIIADWGTGTEEAGYLLERLLIQNVDLIIHLGDIYYSGTTSEAVHNFADVLNETGVIMPVYSLAGNHDMYSGGIGYYQLLPVLHQPASYFCLRNAGWQILAMDTGYHDNDPNTVDSNITYLEDAEAAWHLDKINNAGGRKTILLSHHQLFSPFGDGVGKDAATNKYFVTNPKLLNVFAPVLGKINLWLWGHEHNLNLFQPYNGLAMGRCVGASAVPERDAEAYTMNTSLDPGGVGTLPALIADKVTGKPIQLQMNTEGEYFHCYTVLRLASVGGGSVAEYYQIDSANNGQESILYSEAI